MEADTKKFWKEKCQSHEFLGHRSISPTEVFRNLGVLQTSQTCNKTHREIKRTLPKMFILVPTEG